MGLLSFFKFFTGGKAQKAAFAPDEYVPSFWEDDYCQVEIVPAENSSFIQQQAKQIERAASASGTEYGFTEMFCRDPLPYTTISKEIRASWLEQRLTELKFQKARYIRYDKSKILDCETGSTKAYGLSNFTIFFDTEGAFVKHIWINTGLIVSGPQFDLIQDSLYSLGEGFELILIDWNSLQLCDLADRKQIQDYLM